MASEEHGKPHFRVDDTPHRAFSPPPATVSNSHVDKLKAKRVLNSSIDALPITDLPSSTPLGLLYKYVIVRNLPNSFATSSIQDHYKQTNEDATINLSLAKQQFQRYCSVLANYIPNLVKLDPDESLPDCVFVEDTAVIIGSTAVLTHPGHPSRVNEVSAVKEALMKVIKITNVFEMHEPATLDGGDVLWTGRHLFVGLSARTNKEGAQFLRTSFPKINVIEIPISSYLHLKTVVTHANESVLISVDSESGRDVIKRIQEATQNVYTVVWIPPSEQTGANVVRIDPNTLIVQGGAKYDETHKILRDALPNYKLIPIEMSEFAKADGSLTCCSILF